jgi:hypothetical protein
MDDVKLPEKSRAIVEAISMSATANASSVAMAREQPQKSMTPSKLDISDDEEEESSDEDESDENSSADDATSSVPTISKETREELFAKIRARLTVNQKHFIE